MLKNKNFFLFLGLISGFNLSSFDVDQNVFEDIKEDRFYIPHIIDGVDTFVTSTNLTGVGLFDTSEVNYSLVNRDCTVYGNTYLGTCDTVASKINILGALTVNTTNCTDGSVTIGIADGSGQDVNVYGPLGLNTGSSTGTTTIGNSLSATTVLGATTINTTGIQTTSIGNSTGTLGLTGSTISVTGTTNNISATTNYIRGSTNINTDYNAVTNIGSYSNGANIYGNNINISSNATTYINNSGANVVIGNGGSGNLYLDSSNVYLNYIPSGAGDPLNLSGGRIQTLFSSRKFKSNINELIIDPLIILDQMPSEKTFNYNSDLTRICFGYIAEEFDEVSDLKQFVSHDADNNPYSIRYQDLFILAIAALRKVKAKLEKLETDSKAEILDLQSRMEALEKRIKNKK